MKKLITTAIAGLMLAVAAPAAAGDAADEPDQNLPQASAPKSVDQLEPSVAKTARLLLSGYHGLPSKQQLEDKLPNTRQVLMAYAQDERVFPLYRKRALRALGYYADDEVQSLYEAMLADSDTEDMVRHTLLGLLAEHFGADGVSTIEPYLYRDDVQLRLTAVEALRKIDSDAALDALNKAKKEETNQIVKRRLEEATRIVK
ncbi:MAG: HEAT repeat domain-containing protein [Myxococcota bacterium]